MKNLKVAEDFVEGKHGIGYVDSQFFERVGVEEFEKVEGTPKFQVLPRDMSDAEIESELKPGICGPADILAFLENPPEGSKDGYANLFYLPNCVVFVYWYSGGRDWIVGTWQRDDDGWLEGERVFSPATGLLEPKPSGTLALELLEVKIRVGDKEVIFVPKQ